MAGEQRLLERLLGPRDPHPRQPDEPIQTTVEIHYTADCPNAAPIIDRARLVASTHTHVAVITTLVNDGDEVPTGFAGSPTVLIDGTNPFGGAPTEAPACALRPPTADEVESAILTAL